MHFDSGSGSAKAKSYGSKVSFPVPQHWFCISLLWPQGCLSLPPLLVRVCSTAACAFPGLASLYIRSAFAAPVHIHCAVCAVYSSWAAPGCLCLFISSLYYPWRCPAYRSLRCTWTCLSWACAAPLRVLLCCTWRCPSIVPVLHL